MAILKIITKEYKNSNAISNVVHYILNPEKTFPYHVIGGQGVSMDNPVNCMMTIKNIYCQTDGKMLEHFILSFTDEEYHHMGLILMYKIAYRICEFFSDLQVVFSWHTTQEQLHIHFCINNVNISSGKKYHFGLPEMYDLRNHINIILKEYKITKEEPILAF